MRQSKTSPYITALVYVLIAFILSELYSRLLFPRELVHYVLDLENGRVQLYIAPEYFSRIYYEPLAYVISFLIYIVEMMLGAGMVIFALNVARRTDNSVGNLFDGFGQFLRIFGLYFMEGVFIFLWALLFVFPGIVAAYRYRLAIYLLLEHREMGIMDCIRESKRLMSGRKLELFVMDLSFLGWYLLAVIPFVGLVVNIYVTPYVETTRAGFYLAVTGIDAQRDRGGRYGVEYERERRYYEERGRDYDDRGHWGQ